MRRKRDANPLIKVEFIEIGGTVHDITRWYLSGANFEQIRERAPDEIQAGNFDLVMRNHDNKFSEYISGSLLDGVQYHGARIRVSVGFRLSDGTEVYEEQMTGMVDQLTCTSDSTAIFRCRDRIRYIVDALLHIQTEEEVPAVGGSNSGDGVISKIQTKPFSTVSQTWTITCTLGGGNDTAQFSVVGSVSGSVGPATSGQEFSSESAGIRFTISAGDVNWGLGDSFTFETKLAPQWDQVNPAKIIWSVLTGYNWDTNLQEAWSDFVLDLDHTQSDSNVDLHYDSFAEAVSILDDIGVFNLKGYAAYSESAVQFIQGLLTIFLGSMFTGNDGRIRLKAYAPSLGETTSAIFSDSNKISILGYSRSVDEIINAVSVEYKAADVWAWSNDTDVLDGSFSKRNDESVTRYKAIGASFSLRWFSNSGQHAQDFANKLLSKYADPPLNVDFITKLDALKTNIGDIIQVVDTKYGINFSGEVSRVTKMFDEKPKKIGMRFRKESGETRAWGFVGSEEDEGDGLSPQSDDFDTASSSDKQFAYFSADGEDEPNYRMF